jgi:hypothetical protein
VADDPVLEPPPPAIDKLSPAPPALAGTREALHRLAEDVLSPIQAAVNGDIHFRWTPGGFGTPRFGEDRQLRVEGDCLVVAAGGESRTQPITSLREMASFVGGQSAGFSDARLEVDDAAARWLGDFFGFAFGVLEQIAADGKDPAPIRLWPEHFDIANEMGIEAGGSRATYGASPGDDNHAEPYLYVGPWRAPSDSPELWNAKGFVGAELTLSDLLAAEDQRAAALEFFRQRMEALG